MSSRLSHRTGRLLSLTTVVSVVMTAVLVIGTGTAHASDPTLPTPNVDLDYQLGGDADVPANVGIVVRDRTSEPLTGVYNVCYVNGFQTQPTQKRFWRRHWNLVLKRRGRPVVDSVWGEWLLDIRTGKKRRALAAVVGRWTKRCAKDGFDAVEFDNLDSWSRSKGLVKRRQAKAFAAKLVRRAHRTGLAAGQKNWAEWDGSAVGFDFAVAESCARWDECGRYVSSYGDLVLAIEYSDKFFAQACADYGARLAIVRRDVALSPAGPHAWC